jgi:tetratricopeptide (TPR) repeat protein
MIKKITLFFCLVGLSVTTVLAQTDYKQLYFNGKNFFREGKYNLAMEVFKKVIPYDQANPFSEYASFYYALAAYNQGYKSVAKDQLNQLKTLYPKWDKMDEVNFWIGKIHIDNKDYFQGLKLLSGVQDRKLQPTITDIKQKALGQITDKETLRMMVEDYPKDETIGTALATLLSKDLSNAEDRVLLESLIKKFNLKSSDFIPEAPKTFFKDVYSVSVLFPFMVSSLEPSPTKKRNQIVLDLYEGMKLAVDTLAKQGITISLRAYDTERNVEKIKKIIETEELKNTDLIVGPIYPEENKVVQDFSLQNRINVFNPVSNNSDNIGTNPYAFLFQPSFETIGKKSGEFLSTYAKKKNCIVFYGNTKRDSVLATNFVQKAGEHGLTIVSVQPVTKEESGSITTLLATPTEYDEFKYPKEFSLKKDSIGSIYVASDDALIFSKVISGVETRGDSIVVLGSENWLGNASFEKYQRLGLVLSSPTFTSVSSRNYKFFVRKFIRRHGRTPSNFAKLGYEFMLFAGQQLKKNGVYFQDGMSKEKFIPGYLSEGYNFQFGRDNQLVPFVRFIGGELRVIGKR